MKSCLLIFSSSRLIFMIYMNLIYRTGFISKRDYSQELMTETFFLMQESNIPCEA